MAAARSEIAGYLDVVRSLDWMGFARRYRFAVMKPSDLDEVMQIERRVYPDPWSRWVFIHEMMNNPMAHLLVLKTRTAPGRLVGYISMRIHEQDAHLTNLALRPDMTGRGLGKYMLAFAMDYAARRDARWMWLEVRKSNERARRLYRRFRFKFIRELPRYYPNGEDALVLMVAIRPLLDEILRTPEKKS